jgi:predicted nucleic acid-binding protein
MRQRAVIDANIALASVVRLDYSPQAARCLDHLLRSGTELLVPSLWHYEVLSGLRRLQQANRLTREEAGARIEALMGLGLRSIDPAPDLLARGLHWAEDLDQSRAYDAMYLAVAEAFEAELWTADRRLAGRARQLGLDWVHDVIDASAIAPS